MKLTKERGVLGVLICLFGLSLMGFADAFADDKLVSATIGLVGWVIVLGGIFLMVPAIANLLKKWFPQRTEPDDKINSLSTKLADGVYLNLPATTVLITSIQLDVDHLMHLVSDYVIKAKELHREAIAVNSLLQAITTQDRVKVAYWSGRVGGVAGSMADVLELNPKLAEPILIALSKQKGALSEWEDRYLTTARDFIGVAGQIQANLIHLQNKAATGADKALVADARRKVSQTRGLFNFPLRQNDDANIIFDSIIK